MEHDAVEARTEAAGSREDATTLGTVFPSPFFLLLQLLLSSCRIYTFFSSHKAEYITQYVPYAARNLSLVVLCSQKNILKPNLLGEKLFA